MVSVAIRDSYACYKRRPTWGQTFLTFRSQTSPSVCLFAFVPMFPFHPTLQNIPFLFITAYNKSFTFSLSSGKMSSFKKFFEVWGLTLIGIIQASEECLCLLLCEMTIFPLDYFSKWRGKWEWISDANTTPIGPCRVDLMQNLWSNGMK